MIAESSTWPFSNFQAAGASSAPDNPPGPFNELQWLTFKRRLKEGWRVDLEGYREERIQSRISSWMRRHGIDTLEELIRRMQEDEGIFYSLQDALFINTSSFFRDEGVFNPLRERILPELVQRFGRLDIWSAGCSFGAEPYTVAILLWEMGQGGGRHRIVGTDIDTAALRQAEKGVFYPQHLEKLPEPLRRKYFRDVNGRFVIDPRVKQDVVCHRHDLLREPPPPPGTFHLILCRNVLIYFTPETQRHVVSQLAAAIPVGGYFIIGGTEGIFDHQHLGLERDVHAVYRKVRAG